MDGIYIKDLTVIKSHPLEQILLVDNSVHSFGLQLANGIPIVPFYDDGQDQELVHLASYVLSLANVDNLVSVNSSTFKLEELKAADLTSYLQQEQQEQHADQNEQFTITEADDEDESGSIDNTLAGGVNRKLNFFG